MEETVLKNYFDDSPTIFCKWSLDEDLKIEFITKNSKKLLGYDADVLIKNSSSYMSLVFEEDKEFIQKEIKENLFKNKLQNFTLSKHRVISTNNTCRWVNTQIHSFPEDKEDKCFFGYISDVTLLQNAQDDKIKYLASLESSNKELIKNINNLHEYKQILDETNIVSISDPEGIITYVNNAFLETFGYTKEEVIGKPHSILRHPDVSNKVFREMWDTITNKKIWNGSIKNKRKDGSALYANVTISPFLNENREIEKYMSVRHDITNLVLQTQAIKHQAITDPLTKLGNRNKLLLDLQTLNNPGLAIFDILSFNEINDFYGYKIGDEIIQQLGNKISSFATLQQYRFYRMYADQFAVLADIESNKIFESDMQDIHKKLKVDLFRVSDETIHLRTLCAITYESSDKLLVSADIAKNHAILNNLDFLIYSEDIELSKEYETNIYWQKKIRYALQNDQFIPFFQPILNNKTKEIEKYEALVRLQQDNEIISPFMFLNIAKKTNLYPDISYIMVEKTLSFFADKTFTCTLNIELENIKDKNFCIYLWEAIKKYKMQNRVTLELVESEGIENFQEIEEFLAQARSLGCELAIDDFGTGYSNFNYLIKLNADFIKLDGSIVKEINNPKSGAKNIISAIVLFAKGQGMKTVAEFVSSKEIFDSVCEIGIDYSQGYFISEPRPTLK